MYSSRRVAELPTAPEPGRGGRRVDRLPAVAGGGIAGASLAYAPGEGWRRGSTRRCSPPVGSGRRTVSHSAGSRSGPVSWSYTTKPSFAAASSCLAGVDAVVAVLAGSLISPSLPFHLRRRAGPWRRSDAVATSTARPDGPRL